MNPPTRGFVYDNERKVLYSLEATGIPVFSQNQTIYLIASKDNGVTWSVPYPIKDVPIGNINDANLSIDKATGDLYVTWYDSRNDQPGNRFLEFFGAVVSAKELKKLTKTVGVTNTVGENLLKSSPRPLTNLFKTHLRNRFRHPRMIR